MNDELDSGNLLFQSEHHPLVPLEIESRESYCLSLIHQKAYSRAAEMADNLQVLDLGCNNDYGTMMMAKRCAEVIGVDVSAHAVEATTASHGGPNIEYRVIDGKTLPFGDNTVDLITSFQVIEHVELVEPYLREIRRVLRDTGHVVFTTPNRCIRLEPGMKPWNPFHVREYDAAGLENTLRAAFPNVSVEGLFAAPALYEIEQGRADRAKKAARRSRAARSLTSLRVAARAAVIDGVKAVLPDRLVQHLRATAANTSESDPAADDERAALAEFVTRWSLSDLYYRNEELDKALDLIAICSMGNSASNLAASNH